MHKIAAELRHRELTQEIYNIGDEVVDYIEHLIEAIEDWDDELSLDCLAELGDIVEDARVDSGRCVGELIGLRQALVSGLKSGTISAASSGDNDVEEPKQLTARALAEGLPISGPPVVVSELAETLRGRTACASWWSTCWRKPTPWPATSTWFPCRTCTSARENPPLLPCKPGVTPSSRHTPPSCAPCAGTTRRPS